MTTFLDLTRLFTRLLRDAPTGIDRVELAFARQLVQHERHGEVVSVLTTPFLNGAVGTAAMREHLARIERGWRREAERPLGDVLLGRIGRAVDAPAEERPPAPLRLKREAAARTASRVLQFSAASMAGAVPELRRALRDTAGRPRAYLHTSHTQLDSPRRFDWLGAGSVPAVFFLHDTIPLDYPEFCSPGSAERHLTRLETIARLARTVIVNSETTRRSIFEHLDPVRWPRLQVQVVPLAVDEAFSRAPEPPQPISARPYFLVVGTIEPRKNLLFLLALWRELARRHGSRTPRLVIAGRRGWENEMILDVLDRSSSLAPHVIEVSGLSDTDLARLMGGARALLAPSEVEGFGLPLLEALAVGTPVVASDIPAHREAAGRHATLLSHVDGLGWIEAIEALSHEEAPARAAMLAKAAAFRPVRWEKHVADAMEIVRRAAGDAASAGHYAYG